MHFLVFRDQLDANGKRTVGRMVIDDAFQYFGILDV